MKLGVVNIYSFPHGLAATNRILAYTKGIVINGSDCEIISLKPQVRTDKHVQSSGFVDGVKYIHFFQISPSKNRVLASIKFRLGNMICYWKSMWYIFRNRRGFDAIILSLDQPSLLVPLVLLLRMIGVPMFTIADEFPTPIRHKLKDRIPAWKSNLYGWIGKFVMGRILMTQKLIDFYDKIRPLPSLLLSTVTDTDRFYLTRKSLKSEEYLCYMGNMELSKDNVDNIIRAFSLIHPVFPELKFYLYGMPSSKDKKILEREINRLSLNDFVIFKGLASFEDVPQILSSAKILVTSQPATKRAEGGFPTKMGEYMMTGVPCVLTNVGEISNYVTHMKDCYVVPPGDYHKYADVVKYILNNYDEALKVAGNAIKNIECNYSCKSAGEKIIGFISRLIP